MNGSVENACGLTDEMILLAESFMKHTEEQQRGQYSALWDHRCYISWVSGHLLTDVYLKENGSAILEGCCNEETFDRGACKKLYNYIKCLREI